MVSGRVVNTSTSSIAERLGEAEAKLQPAALADPIFLHQPHLVGPLIEALQSLEQIVGEVGDLEEPLGELAPLDGRPGAPAPAVDHLLIGEHGHVNRVPIDLALLAIDEAGVKQVQEQRLLMAVICGVAGRELPRPVERETDALELLAHCPDVCPGPFAGMDLALYRRILRRHAERVPPHRVKHLHALHAPIAGEHVAHGVIADVAHVNAPRWIGEHLQHIGLGLVAVAVGAEGLRLVPPRLPAAVGLSRVEPAAHGEALPTSAASAPIVFRGDRSAAQVTSPGQDYILELLNRRGANRRIVPGTVRIDLLGGRDADCVGAQIRVEHSDSELDPLSRHLWVAVPVGDDHPAARVGLEQRREGNGIDRRPPQIGIDRQRRHLRRRELVRQIAVAGAASGGEGQHRQSGGGRVEAVHLGSLGIGKRLRRAL